MKYLWLVMLLLSGCLATGDQSAQAAATACSNVTASCYCTATLTTDLRCVECTGTPQFVEQCTPTSGSICCATDDGSLCACGSGTACTTNAGQVAVCFAGQQGGDPTPGDSDDGDGATCTTTGFCSLGSNTCRCGATCRNYGVQAYVCGFACTSDSDCTSRIDPATQQPYARCQLGVTAGSTTYDSYCVP